MTVNGFNTAVAAEADMVKKRAAPAGGPGEISENSR
jgi:hypothetical protein